MAVSQGVSKWLFAGVGILIALIVIVVLALSLTKQPSADQLVVQVVELRNVEDSVKKAQLISSIDEQVMRLGSSNLAEQWERVTQCLPSGCPDEAFFDTIFIVANEFSVEQSELIMHVLFVNRYWDDEERVVEFSKSLSEVDSMVPELGRKVERAWGNVIECNNACDDKNDRYFEMLTTLMA